MKTKTLLDIYNMKNFWKSSLELTRYLYYRERGGYLKSVNVLGPVVQSSN